MDIRFLESLLAVVDQGSIARAARSQALTPAAISQRIQTLEQQLNCQLLSRASHKAKPTEACIKLLPRARHLIRESEELALDVKASALSGQIRMGVISTALTGLMPSVIRNMALHAPDVKLQIRPGTSAELYQALIDEQIDVAVIVKPPFSIPKELVTQTIHREPLVLLTPEPFDSSIREALRAKPYIRYDPLSWGGRLVEQFLQQAGYKLESLCDLDALETIALLISQGMGVSIVPQWKGIPTDMLGLTVTPLGRKSEDRELVLIRPYHPKRQSVIHKLETLIMAI